MFGELIPVGGGDPIPLLKKTLQVGRRESCDVVLRFANVSAHHCQFFIKDGYWYVKDLNSRNGTKVNKVRVTEKLIKPNDMVGIARHKYTIHYDPFDLGAVGPPPEDDAVDLKKSLLDRSGLNSPWSQARGDDDDDD